MSRCSSIVLYLEEIAVSQCSITALYSIGREYLCQDDLLLYCIVSGGNSRLMILYYCIIW